MKYFLSLCFCLALVTSTGCGGTATRNVGESADAKAVADYEAQMAADQKALDAAENSGN